jgi:phosphatidylglycerophosphate synthase
VLDARCFISRKLLAHLIHSAGDGSAVASDSCEGAAPPVGWLRAAARVALANRLVGVPELAAGLGSLADDGLASRHRAPFPEFVRLVASRSELSQATRQLFRSIYKPTDNLYARLNRKLSLPLTRLLLPTPVSANLMTLLTMGVGLAAGLLLAQGNYGAMAWGAVLSYLAAVLDGCDGEIARLKFEESPLGCWLDSVADYAYYFIYFGGVAVGLYRQHSEPWVIWAGASALIGTGLSQAVTAHHRRRFGGSNPSGFATMVQQELEKVQSRSTGAFLAHWLNQYAKRSTMPFWCMIMVLLDGAAIVLLSAAVFSWCYLLGALFVRRFYPRSLRPAAVRPVTAGLEEPAGAPSRRPLVP